MIFPQGEETEFSVIHCPTCKGYFVKFGGVNIGCCVNHPAGDCCHYSDKSISEEKAKKLMEEVKG